MREFSLLQKKLKSIIFTMQPKQIRCRSGTSKNIVPEGIVNLNKKVRFKHRLFHQLDALDLLVMYFLQKGNKENIQPRKVAGQLFMFLGLVLKTHQGRSLEAMVLKGHDVFRLYLSY